MINAAILPAGPARRQAAADRCACHFDCTMYQAWWSDLYNGPDLKTLEPTDTTRLASRLKGKLLFIHGGDG